MWTFSHLYNDRNSSKKSNLNVIIKNGLIEINIRIYFNIPLRIEMQTDFI